MELLDEILTELTICEYLKVWGGSKEVLVYRRFDTLFNI